MINKNTVLTLTKKEFKSFFNSPLAYVVTVPFLLISSFLYFRQIIVTGEASLRPFFEFLPWLLLFLIPALAMNLLSQEEGKGTIELLLAHPIKPVEIVLAKFLGSLSFYLVVLAATLSLPATLFLFSKPDPGIIFSQYLGAVFLGSMFLSVSLTASSFVKNTIGAFLLGASICFAFILIGLDMVLLTLPWPFSKIVGEIAVLPHVRSIARGVLDLRDLVYFLGMTIIFLSAATAKLLQSQIKELKNRKRKQILSLGLIILFSIAVNLLFQFYPLRLDLTKNNLFTLSQGTKQTLSSLNKKVVITLYASRNLPANLQATQKNVDDLLKDYNRLSPKIQIEFKYPDEDPNLVQEAQLKGVQQMTFNTIGASKFEVQQGFLGLVISVEKEEKQDQEITDEQGVQTPASDKNQEEVIPFISETADLEYQLTRRIRKLASNEEKTVAIYNQDFQNQYQALSQALQTQYMLEYTDLNDSQASISAAGLVFIDGTDSKETTASAVLKDYLDKGGKVLVLTKGVMVSPQQLNVSKKDSDLLKFLKDDYGIRVNQDMVYDLELNEPVALGQGQVRYIIPYPYWLRALPAENDFAPSSGIDSVILGWPSSLSIEKKQGVNYISLLETSLTAGKQEDNFIISPQQTNMLPSPIKKHIPLGIAVEKGDTKLAVVADYTWAADQFIQGDPQNLSLLSGLVDWLVLEKDLASIPSKTNTPNIFRFTDPSQPKLVQYFNILGPSILVIVFAIFWLSARKRLTQRQYKR